MIKLILFAMIAYSTNIRFLWNALNMSVKVVMFMVILYAVMTQRVDGAHTECWEYKECAEGATITASSAYDILCYASFSCSSAVQLSTGDDMTCFGARSCADTTLTIYTGGRSMASCNGAQSCSNSAINMKGVYCLGTESCSNSNINGATNVYGWGAFSLSKSTISLIDGGTIELFGHLAGNYANIICPTSSQCSAICKGSGCAGFTLSGEGNWEITKINPNYEKSQFVALVGFGAIINDQTCTQLFDGYLPQSDIVDVGTGSVCCRGYDSCKEVGEITMVVTTTHSLLCSGYRSCMDVNTIQAYSANIICSGQNSCQNTQMISFGDIHCFGSVSCFQSNITTNGDAVICGGSSACVGAIIFISNSNNFHTNVFLTGYMSGQNLIIHCMEGVLCSIICLGAESCDSSTTVICAGKCDIQCTTDTGCPPTMSPTNAPTTTSPTSSSPTQSPTTNPTNDPTMEPTFNPTMYPTYQPTFLPTKFPSYDPTHIPTKFPTYNPTNIPTKFPTYYPTYDPTYIPTKFPSYDPTYIPTKFPTYDPTYIPTKFPTNTPTKLPSYKPSGNPTNNPTKYPTEIPTFTPTKNPTISPSANPSVLPTIHPSLIPSETVTPTNDPTATRILETIFYNNESVAVTESNDEDSVAMINTGNSTATTAIIAILTSMLSCCCCVFIIVLVVCIFRGAHKDLQSYIQAAPHQQNDVGSDMKDNNENDNSNKILHMDYQNNDEKHDMEYEVQMCGIVHNIRNDENADMKDNISIANGSDKNDEELYAKMPETKETNSKDNISIANGSDKSDEELWAKIPANMGTNEKDNISMVIGSDKNDEELYAEMPANKEANGKYESVKSWFDSRINIPNANDIYYQLFVDNGYDTLEIVQLLNENKLRTMEINKQGHIDKIMMEINNLKHSYRDEGNQKEDNGDVQ